ncbi:MAG TPA: sigma-E factor regulatory protein RseB domain-containing protein, partial [Mycobacteriales bacterium]|nr:sigma-E factor regulatory protein RseB domain-containing protein [Mycobacteriales bacterium]
MRPQRLVLAVAGGAALLVAVPALGVPCGDPSPPRDGIALLANAARAARRLSYHGTQMVSFWSATGATSAMIDVSHVAGTGLLLRVAATPQSPGGAVYDDEDGTVPEVVGFAKGTLTLLADHYEVSVEGAGAVAGRAADVVAVRRPGRPPSARFWLDRATALPLRREVLDTDGRTIRESAFIQLTVGPTVLSKAVLDSVDPMPVVAGAELRTTDLESLRRNGWHVPAALPSGLELVAARLHGAGDEATLQLVYADGVTTASVFEQRGRLDTGSLRGWERARVGPERVWVQGAFP